MAVTWPGVEPHIYDALVQCSTSKPPSIHTQSMSHNDWHLHLILSSSSLLTCLSSCLLLPSHLNSLLIASHSILTSICIYGLWVQWISLKYTMLPVTSFFKIYFSALQSNHYGTWDYFFVRKLIELIVFQCCFFHTQTHTHSQNFNGQCPWWPPSAGAKGNQSGIFTGSGRIGCPTNSYITPKAFNRISIN